MDSTFLNQPNVEELLSSICQSLTSLREDKPLQLSVDEAIVNWKILELFNEKLESKDSPKTLNIARYLTVKKIYCFSMMASEVLLTIVQH